MKGRLKQHATFWENPLQASEGILSIIRHGITINFTTIPPRAILSNNASALKHKDFVVSEINTLLDSGCIKEQFVPPYVTNPLTVSEEEDKCRLILDLRYVNVHIPKEYVRYDDWRIFTIFLEENGWAYKFDLKSGYHHIDVHETSQKYLGFSREEKRGPSVFCIQGFTVWVDVCSSHIH